MKQKIMWGCGGLLVAVVVLSIIGALIKSPNTQGRTPEQAVNQAEHKSTQSGQSAADESAKQEEDVQRELYEQRQRQRAEEERQRAEEERSKSETAGLTVEPNSYYKFYADGSCKPSGSTVCLERETFQALCRKTKRFENEIFDTLANLDNTVLALQKNMGYSAFTDVLVVDLDKGAPCAISFQAKGALNGNSIQKNYACPVTTIKSDNAKVLSASSISVLACINPK